MNKNTKIIVGLALTLVLAVGVAFGIMWLIPADTSDKENTSQTTASVVTEDAPTEDIEYNIPINSHTDTPDTSEPVETDTVTEESALTENTESKPVENEPAQTTKPSTTTATSKQPAVTVVTTSTTDSTPPSTVRTDRPVVTTTAHTTTTTAADNEPEIEAEYDDDGFPDNPSNNQHFTDDNGKEWVYDSIFGWVEDGGDNIQYEFPDNYGPIGEGEQILS